MSGFAVAVDRARQPVADPIIERLAGALAHRGPDGMSTAVRGNVAVVHGALHTTPESRLEVQPLRAADGTWYVSDARIDNRSELLAALGWQRPASTVTDLELLAGTHQRWGTGGLDRVVGDFALVVISADGRLTCYRDHLGVKPLYYWSSSRWLVVASELRQILAHPEAPRQLDPGLAGQYLTGWVEDASATIVSGVHRLPAAHGLELGYGVRCWRYWTLPLDEPLDPLDAAGAAERGREVLTEAVRCRLRSDGPVACELSGGLDSTSIAAVAQHLGPGHGVQTYSCLFPGCPGTDERSYIDTAVAELGLDWEPIISEPGRPRWVGGDVAFSGDIPLPPDGPDHLALCTRARERGGKVVLSGHGGDHWFDVSHLVLADLVEHRELAGAWAVARGMVGGGRLAALDAIVRHGLVPHKPGWVIRPGRVRAPWVTGEARLQARLDQRRVPGRLPRRFASLIAQRRYEAEAGGYEAMTRELIDRVGARAGVEYRHPYLDRRLVELACRLPVTAHVEPGRNRALQRRAVAGLVPPVIAERTTKASFSAVWLREVQRHLPVGAVASSALVERGWVDAGLVRQAMTRTARVVQARAGGADLIALWGVVQVEALLGHASTGWC